MKHPDGNYLRGNDQTINIISFSQFLRKFPQAHACCGAKSFNSAHLRTGLTRLASWVYNDAFRTPAGTGRGAFLPHKSNHIKNKMEKKIRALKHELAHKLPKVIKKAVAMCALSENAEYL